MPRIYGLIPLLIVLSVNVAAQGKAGIRKVDFRNNIFPFGAGAFADLPRRIHVRNGRYHSPHQEPSLTYSYFKVAEVVFGDLNGDNQDDAAVIAIYGGASSDTYGTSVYLYAMNGRRPKLVDVLNQKAVSREYERRYDGGRSQLFESVADGTTIKRGLLTVKQLAGGGHCCPLNVFTLRYRLKEGRLALVSESLRRRRETEERIPHSVEDR
ncbi:MAG TPA: hypothetical protein VJ810_05335 [Blastocatellia bacterium]|nr:hypothetical protein [Blastocatellia bacterium]